MKKVFLISCFSMLTLSCFAQLSSNPAAQQHMEIADKYIAAKDYEKAIEYCNKAIAAGADRLQVLRKRASLNFIGQKHADAIGDFSELIKLAPDKAAEYYYMRALASLDVQPAFSGMCADLLKAKELGYSGDWKAFETSCPQLRKRNE